MKTDQAKSRIPLRGELEREFCWDLEAIYPTPEDWSKDFKRIDNLVAPILTYQGQLRTPEGVAGLFAAEDALSLLMERLYVYAHLREDEDTGNSSNQARTQRVLAKHAEVAGKTAWIEPEILAQPLETLETWRDHSALQPYRRTMTQLIRRKPHILSEKEETLLSLASEIFRKPHEAFSFLTNADMTFPDVKDEKGQPQPLSNGRFITFMENRHRDVRRRAFETFYDTYIGYKNTITSTLGGAVKLHSYNARIRHFGSALEASLHPDNVPVNLYDTLIESVHEALPIFHEYIDLRKQALKVDDLNMHDLYVPIVPDFDLKVDWKQAVDWVRQSTNPLGPEYKQGVDAAFSQRWVDVYENKGKRSGAYSGGGYDTYSYILMNYQGTLDHVFTLAHELGHSLHSWLSNRTQPYRYADYAIFVAEIASTTNEALLLHYLLHQTEDPKFRAYLLNHLCDQFRGTVVRQAMFAEFERTLHEMDARGEPLTSDVLCEAYYALNAKYHGPKIKADERIAYEWMRIPHFYYNFYVYKYATGFCAAQVFVKRILEGGGRRDQYIEFLKSGGSDDPLALVRKGGVDLLDRDVLTGAFEQFRKAIEELGSLL